MYFYNRIPWFNSIVLLIYNNIFKKKKKSRHIILGCFHSNSESSRGERGEPEMLQWKTRTSDIHWLELGFIISAVDWTCWWALLFIGDTFLKGQHNSRNTCMMSWPNQSFILYPIPKTSVSPFHGLVRLYSS